jgi:hypothetical protein
MATAEVKKSLQFELIAEPKYAQKTFEKPTLGFKTKIAILVGTIGIGCIAAFVYSYKNQFSPSLESHDVTTSPYRTLYNEYADGCTSFGHHAQELFFNIFETNRYISDLIGLENHEPVGALLAFLEDRNKEAFMCTYYSKDISNADKNSLLTKVLNRYEREGSDAFAELLIRDGANPNVKYDNLKPLNPSIQKYTPLLKAYEMGDENFMEFLFDSGANANSNLRFKTKSREHSFSNNAVSEPGRRHYQEDYQGVSFYNYVIQNTQKITRKDQSKCSFQKDIIKLIFSHTSPCQDTFESYMCKHLRYYLPSNFQGSACQTTFLTDTYFTQPEWSYTNDLKKTANTVFETVKTQSNQVFKDLPGNLAKAAKALNDSFWIGWEKLRDECNSFYEKLKKEQERQNRQNNHQRNRRREAPPKDQYPIPSSSYEAKTILGLGLGYSRKDLRRACKQMYLKYHPDKVRALPGNEQEVATQKFYQVQQACEILKQ